jgi:TRAP-type C4-dicarboxylate transport system permease small subunit
MVEKFVNGINTLLMVNLFFVLFCFAWLVASLVGRQLSIPLGFDIWYSLWPMVIQPAIGILMAGSILTGLVSQIRKRWPSSQSE